MWPTVPADYMFEPVTITFGPSSPDSVDVPVTLIDDDIVEDDEQFTAVLSLVEPDSAFLNPEVATVTIPGAEPNDGELLCNGFFLPYNT